MPGKRHCRPIPPDDTPSSVVAVTARKKQQSFIFKEEEENAIHRLLCRSLSAQKIPPKHTPVDADTLLIFQHHNPRRQHFLNTQGSSTPVLANALHSHDYPPKGGQKPMKLRPIPHIHRSTRRFCPRLIHCLRPVPFHQSPLHCPAVILLHHFPILILLSTHPRVARVTCASIFSECSLCSHHCHFLSTGLPTPEVASNKKSGILQNAAPTILDRTGH